MTVIPFRPRHRPSPTTLEPTFTILVYDHDLDDGFEWYVTGEGDPPTKAELAEYLADMLVGLRVPRRAPSFLAGAKALFKRVHSLFTGTPS